MRWNRLSHVVIGTLNAGLGWVLGGYCFAHRVVSSNAIALAVGSLVLIVSFRRRHVIPRGTLLFGTLRPVPLAIVGVCAQWALFYRLHGRLPLAQLLVLELAGGAAFFALLVCLHPSSRALLIKLKSRASLFLAFGLNAAPSTRDTLAPDARGRCRKSEISPTSLRLHRRPKHSRESPARQLRVPTAHQYGAFGLKTIRSSPACRIMLSISARVKRCSRRVPKRSSASVRMT